MSGRSEEYEWKSRPGGGGQKSVGDKFNRYRKKYSEDEEKDRRPSLRPTKILREESKYYSRRLGSDGVISSCEVVGLYYYLCKYLL